MSCPAAATTRHRPGLAVAAIIFGILWLLIFHNEPPKAGAVIAQGTVIDQQISTKGLCAPLAELRIDGTRYTAQSGTSAEPCGFEIGDAIEVSYYPDDIAGTLEVPMSKPARNLFSLTPLIGVAALAFGVTSLVRRGADKRRAARSAAIVSD